MHRRVAELARRSGLEVVDLAPSVADVDPATLHVAADDAHPDAAAQGRYGRAVAEWMVGVGWLGAAGD